MARVTTLRVGGRRWEVVVVVLGIQLHVGVVGSHGEEAKSGSGIQRSNERDVVRKISGGFVEGTLRRKTNIRPILSTSKKPVEGQ